VHAAAALSHLTDGVPLANLPSNPGAAPATRCRHGKRVAAVETVLPLLEVGGFPGARNPTAAEGGLLPQRVAPRSRSAPYLHCHSLTNDPFSY
jgi:hypothetical protein